MSAPDSTIRMSFSLELEATAFNTAQIDAQLALLSGRAEPQIAFAGRSNVGKSSLINALAGRKNLAKTSSTPGKTRSANFYRAVNSVTGASFTLTDLPGYGYARCSQAERRAWAGLIEYYLSRSSDVRAVALLLDCRLEPQRLDIELADFARGRGLLLLPVLTKADKCSQLVQAARRRAWAALLDGEAPLVVSSSTRRGIAGLWEKMAALCAPPGASALPAFESLTS